MSIIVLAQSAAQAEDGKPVVTGLANQDDFQPRIIWGGLAWDEANF